MEEEEDLTPLPSKYAPIATTAPSTIKITIFSCILSKSNHVKNSVSSISSYKVPNQLNDPRTKNTIPIIILNASTKSISHYCIRRSYIQENEFYFVDFLSLFGFVLAFLGSAFLIIPQLKRRFKKVRNEFNTEHCVDQYPRGNPEDEKRNIDVIIIGSFFLVVGFVLQIL